MLMVSSEILSRTIMFLYKHGNHRCYDCYHAVKKNRGVLERCYVDASKRVQADI